MIWELSAGRKHATGALAEQYTADDYRTSVISPL